MNQEVRRGTFLALVLPSTPPSEDLAAIVEMMNDRSGLWLISDKRVNLVRGHLDGLSSRSSPAAKEMLAIAQSGERFWKTKAEYYTVLSEIRARSSSASKSEIAAAIEGIIKGSKADGMAHREWVKRALDILVKISNEG